MQSGFDKIAIPITSHSDAWLVLTCAKGDFESSPNDCAVIPGTTLIGRSSADPTISIIQDDTDGRIRLIETKHYQWAIEGDVNVASVQSKLDESRRQRWHVRRRSQRIDSGEFCVVNHLGFSSFKLLNEQNEPLLDLSLEFISAKLDFDAEYRRMTEDIAQFCEQLLLSWSAPTALRFSSDPATERKLLLEQFLFLRHFLNEERVGLLLEAISRHPHSKLVKQHQWKPNGTARSADYLSNPARMLRSWQNHGGKKVPGEVLDVHKEDTHDTPPNRFIKFALNCFRHICLEVTELPHATPALEAGELVNTIDALLARRFFREVGPMSRLPLDNQTLQKREGYREILQAWILTQAATTLDWQGNEDCYQGETRDVATLYEYWIFIQLHQILESIDGISRVDGKSIQGGGAQKFISEKDGQIAIHLSSGKHSRSRFLLSKNDNELLNIDLHYERTFSAKDKATSGASYSRQFRPDYTLSLYPASYDTEDAAEKDGKIAHLHFDAKYRATNLKSVFGEDDDEQISEEKREAKSLSTYKRGDLLKMHTYNDALRKTIGSYVLYPGEAVTEPEELRKFHEIAPGVGALVMKPGREECLNALKGFLENIFDHQSSQFTQYRYMNDANHQTVLEEPRKLKEDEEVYQVARTKAPCVLLWLKKKTADVFREAGFAYCHAVPRKESQQLNLDLTIQAGSEFIPCGGGQGERMTSLDWRAKITSARFLSKAKLTEFISERGLTSELSPSSVNHYLLFEFSEPTKFKKIDVTEAHRQHRSGSQYMAVTCKWQDIIGKQ